MSNYGPTWTLGEMAEQVRREAPNKIKRMIEKEGGRIIGSIELKTITGVEK